MYFSFKVFKMNRKPFLILLTSCIASSFAFASPNQNSAKLCANLDGYLLANCVANEHEKASKQLKKTFATVLKQRQIYQGSQAYRHAQKSQQMWQAWVDFECTSSDETFTSSYAPVDFAICAIKKMKLREQELKENADSLF